MMTDMDDYDFNRRDTEEKTSRLLKKIFAVLADEDPDYHVAFLTFMTLLSLKITEQSEDDDMAITSVGFAIERLSSIAADILESRDATLQ